jgi:YesN/AraC family two-component response regulator
MEEKAKILVVDDERGIREGCKRILAAEGHLVDVAENGKVALEMVKSKTYDLMLIDLMMPVMGGIELMEQVRKIDPEAIMIVITGFANYKNCSRCHKVRCI